MGQRGIAIFAGIMEHTGTLAARNVIRGLRISGNQVLARAEGGAVGLELVGGWRSGWAQGGVIAENRMEMVTVWDHGVGGFDTGLRLVGGDGVQVIGNSVSGIGCTGSGGLVQADNLNGAQGNALDWQWYTPPPTPTPTVSAAPTATPAPTDMPTPTGTSTVTPTATSTATPAVYGAHLPLITRYDTVGRRASGGGLWLGVAVRREVRPLSREKGSYRCAEQASVLNRSNSPWY